MISYPYYVKYAIMGDHTGFRHINLNIDNLAKNDAGINQIQGSVSFDNEDANNCTMIIPRLYNRIREWADRLITGGEIGAAGQLVQKIDS